MSTIIGEIEMSNPLILGAGVAKHPNQVLPYLHPDAPLGAAISGSYTLEERQGNQGNLMWPTNLGGLMQHGFGLNAWGMPNLGLVKAMEFFPSGPAKPHLVSIAGFKASDYIEMLELLKGNKQIAGVELNGGCPNTGHLPVAYMLDDLMKLLEEVSKVDFDLPIWLKLSPYMTAHELAWFANEHPSLDFSSTPTVSDEFVGDLCELLAKYPHILSAVVMTNTVPNVVHSDSITVRNTDGSVQHHKGGLSGPILRDHNLKIIGQMVATGITADIDIIGCGGVMTGDDALAYLQVGCTGVQCTSGPVWSDVKFFQSLLEGSEGLQEYLFSTQGATQ
jgi:dihydroorotate dehydrogenase (NAD+) catalytic subunit